MAPTKDPVPMDDRARWRALAICLSAGFMTMLDVSIVNVALPSIENSLNAGPSSLQLIVAGYSLAFGMCLIPAGRLGDLRGRRTMFIVGLVGFVAASAVAGIAPDETTLTIARLAQGMAAGLLNPQVIGLIQEIFPGPERAKAMGLFGATVGVSTALGPLLGGILIQLGGPEHGWRWVFLINVPIILVVLPAALRLLPRSKPKSGSALSLDGVGLILVGIATLTFMLPFVGTTGHDDSPKRWFWLVGAAMAGFLLIVWERRFERQGKHGVLDFELLRTPSFRWGALLGVAYFAGFTSTFLIVTLYLQQALGFSPLEAGLASMPYAIGSAISAALSSRFIARGRRLVIIGLAIVLVGLALVVGVVWVVPKAAGGWAVGLTLAICGVGSGLVISPNQVLSLAQVPVARAGSAAGLLQTGQRLGAAVGTAFALAIFFLVLGNSSPTASGGVIQDGYIAAFTASFAVTVSLVSVALAIAIFDSQRRSHANSAGE